MNNTGTSHVFKRDYVTIVRVISESGTFETTITPADRHAGRGIGSKITPRTKEIIITPCQDYTMKQLAMEASRGGYSYEKAKKYFD